MNSIQIQKAVFILLFVSMLTLTACTGANTADSGEHTQEGDHEAEVLPTVEPVRLDKGRRMKALATTTIIGDVVSNIGEEVIDLTILMNTGQDPHSYEITPKAVVAIQDADLIFINGLDLEETLLDSIESNAAGVIVPVSAGIETLAVDEDDENEDHEGAEDHKHTGTDPHLWTDPNNVITWVDNIAQVLGDADPANREAYTANAAAYRTELEALDAYIRGQVAHIPEENRKLVTDHGLFNYFAGEYGFEVIGTVIPSFSSLAEPSASDIVALVEVIQQEDVPAIFIGTTASPGLQNLADTIAEETGKEIKVLPLLTGSLAAAGEPGDTYLDYMRFNIDQIVLGLGKR
ncbi:MAG: metal ABC transporter substrate-binding protein [Anaerolineales bacterium]|jgi:ABC-type Zn uptake system ZnuABC Zn-binding protein ZnuA